MLRQTAHANTQRRNSMRTSNTTFSFSFLPAGRMWQTTAAVEKACWPTRGQPNTVPESLRSPHPKPKSAQNRSFAGRQVPFCLRPTRAKPPRDMLSCVAVWNPSTNSLSQLAPWMSFKVAARVSDPPYPSAPCLPGRRRLSSAFWMRSLMTMTTTMLSCWLRMTKTTKLPVAMDNLCETIHVDLDHVDVHCNQGTVHGCEFG